MHTPDQIDAWLLMNEDEHLEFKEAAHRFDFEKLVKYCAAMSNEGGGHILLGVTDRPPRRVVGTGAFPSAERTRSGLFERLRLRVDVEEVVHPNGRVLVVAAPPHPIGMPVEVGGTFWMRSGEELLPMSADRIRQIIAEAVPDYSAEICSSASVSDLDPDAIESFRRRWHAKSGNDFILRAPHQELLLDAELLVDGGITIAALVLLGNRQALGRHLAQSEVVFEYRASDAPGPANQRVEFREGFFLYYDRLWDLVNLRNDLQHYQDGLFMVDILTFDEGAIRESVLNAVAHRDYRHGGSIFLRQFPRRIEIVSPGGFPDGITAQNIIDRQLPRNRRIAESLAKCGLVERAGQGANRIFESSIRNGKGLPDFSDTDAYQVSLVLHGLVREPRLAKFLERVARETLRHFNTHELLVLELIHREQPVPTGLRSNLTPLVDAGILESVGRGRGARYLLSRRFHTALGDLGGYTRRRGLDSATNKALLLQHITSQGQEGCPMSDLQQVLPGLSRAQIKRLMDELRRDDQVRLVGVRRWARWYRTGGGPST